MLAHRAVENGEWITGVVALDSEGTGLVMHSLDQRLIEPLTASTVHDEQLRILFLPDGPASGPARTIGVDVSRPEAPVITAPLRLVGFPRQGWVHRMAANEHTMIALFTAANRDRTMGASEIIMVDLETGRVAQRWAGSADAVFCHHACGFVRASGEQISLTIAPQDAPEQSLEVRSPCSVASVSGSGEHALLALTPTGFDGWVIGAGGTVRAIEPASWDDPVECTTPVSTAAGVVFGDRLLRWDDGVKVSATLGTRSEDRLAVVAEHVIAVRAEVSSGMTHSPTDDRGRRRYYESWEFGGAQVRLIDLGDPTTEPERVDAPFPPTDGTMGEGPRFAVLQRDHHAAVIATHSTARPAWFAPLLAPCAP